MKPASFSGKEVNIKNKKQMKMTRQKCSSLLFSLIGLLFMTPREFIKMVDFRVLSYNVPFQLTFANAFSYPDPCGRIEPVYMVQRQKTITVFPAFLQQHLPLARQYYC